jgi:hypothetical protein
MRPQADEVEFLYELMSVTGEATVMMMICLNYLKSIEVIEMEPIPPLAILLCSLLIVAGNLGAQVCLLSISFRSPTVAGFCSPCVQVQAIVLRRILATAEPLHDKLIQRSEFYRHCTEALMERWIRSFRSIPLLGCQLIGIIMQGPEVAASINMLRHAVPRLLDPAKVPSSVLCPVQFDFSLVDALAERT